MLALSLVAPRGAPRLARRSLRPYPARMKIAATAVVAALLVAGCSSSTDGGGSVAPTGTAASSSAPAVVTSAPPVESTPAGPAKDATYGSVVELRDAAIAAGYACPEWTEDDQVANAAESGSCSDADVLCIYASQSSRDAQLAQTRANNEDLAASGITTAIVLFGPNWSISLDDQVTVDSLRASLGGIETK